MGCNLYGDVDHTLFSEEDLFGWRVPEIEEEHDLRPGLEQVARQVLGDLVKFGRGEQENRIVGHNRRLLEGNHYWSPDLDARLGSFVRERYVTLLPVALAKTQDYLGRVRWTLFGNSEQGPEKAFWQSFRTSPDQEIPASEALKFISDLMWKVYRESAHTEDELRQLGFRILPSMPNERFPYWQEKTLPRWTKPFLIEDTARFDNIFYLLTFRPFSQLPAAAREKYLAGQLAMIPSPFSLIPWGMQIYHKEGDQ